MTYKICLFHDYLSLISRYEKLEMLKRMHVDVIDFGFPSNEQESKTSGWGNRLESYRGVVMEAKEHFGRYAASALTAMISAHANAEWANVFSSSNREFFRRISDMPHGQIASIAAWAMNPANWFRIASEEGTYQLQSHVSSLFPCSIFDDVPLECSGSVPIVNFERLEEILRITGVYHAWNTGNFGNNVDVVILDTGVASSLAKKFSIRESAVGGLSAGDVDGHGTAVAQLILSIAPQAKIKSIKVVNSYSGETIWNLISGLTSLFGCSDHVVNISLGVSPRFVDSLGPAGLSFRESITNIISGAASQRCFVVAAAGNDSTSALRWPAAAFEALAVGGQNTAGNLSTFSNYSKSARNFIVAPGGDINEDQTAEKFGMYGLGASRPIYGTSFSSAIATGISAILQNYGWFKTMNIQSRISLYTNHCRKNQSGFPLLNLPDIGAVWPL